METRVNEYVEVDEIKPYWDGEEYTLHEIKEMHEANAQNSPALGTSKVVPGFLQSQTESATRDDREQEFPDLT